MENTSFDFYKDITFEPDKDLSKLNIPSDHSENIKQLLEIYSQELFYWKKKHDGLIKKLRDMVCE